jgi:aryl-alcohol dehydrogenase-like predicted oxidoreductase
MSNPWIKKIGLGTVQFGLPYGISNTKGQVPLEDVREILALANKAGIRILDTARAYGNSEEVLGQAIPSSSDFQVVSKLKPHSELCVADQVRQSLANLRLDYLYGYLFHNYEDFILNPHKWEELLHEKERGRLKKIGFSLYYPQQLESIWVQNIKPDIVQLPYNLFDRRFAPYFAELAEHGTEVHVRSVFLQGLFFMSPKQLPPQFNAVLDKISQLREFSRQYQLSLATIPLFFALQSPEVTSVLLGVNSLEQVRENISILGETEQIKKLNLDLSLFQEHNEEVILPFLWKK